MTLKFVALSALIVLAIIAAAFLAHCDQPSGWRFFKAGQVMDACRW